MKRFLLGLVLLLAVIPVAAWLYFVAMIKIDVRPAGHNEATVPLALAGIEMDVPASWSVASYRTDIVFDKNADWSASSRQATINELDLEGSYDQDGGFNPDLFPSDQSRSLSYEEQGQLEAPENLGRPFKGLVLVNKFDKQIRYLSAMETNGFLLHVTIGLAWPEGREELSPEDHNALYAEQLRLLFEIYEPRPKLQADADLRTRFGRVRQKPEEYFVRQTIDLIPPDDGYNFAAGIWTKGDCGRDGAEYRLCAGLNQFFTPYKDYNSAGDRASALLSGHYQQVLEAGDRKINRLEVYASASVRHNVLPWNFDGGWNSLVTALHIDSGAAANPAGDVMILMSAEDMLDQGNLKERFSAYYGTISKIWESVRPLRSPADKAS